MNEPQKIVFHCVFVLCGNIIVKSGPYFSDNNLMHDLVKLTWGFFWTKKLETFINSLCRY
jgi:hypothetical protein